jgi:hypothetical protein
MGNYQKILAMSATKNRYYKHSRISEAKFRQILRCFALDLTATETAQLTDISVRSINSIYLKVRKRITQLCEQSSPYPCDGESQGSNLGKDDGDPSSKYLVFGIYLDEEKIHTEIAPPCTRQQLQQHPRKPLDIAALQQSAGWKSYDGLVDVRNARLYRILNNSPSTEALANNNIDAFWAYARRRLLQFNGIHKHTFYLHLKESEFRFNYRGDNLYRVLLKLLRTVPL